MAPLRVPGSWSPVALLLVLCAAGCASSGDTPDSTVTFKLIALNDLHGQLRPPGDPTRLGASSLPTGGAVYLASVIQQLKSQNPRNAVVAAGDLIGASPLDSALFHDEPTIESMEALGLDVTSVGNHEFDEGVGELLRIQNGGCHPVDGCYDSAHPYDGTAYPILAANVVDKATREPILAPTWVREVDGVKVDPYLWLTANAG